VPFLVIGAYLITAKDMFAFSVAYQSFGATAKPRSLKYWGGAKTYAPR